MTDNDSKEIANFFWFGELSKFEIVCIKSFVKNGFKVKLWSYDNLELDGCELCDASLILDKNIMNNIKQYHVDFKSEKTNFAAFSDLFRYTLIAKNGGWWFDTDCYCLKNVSYYTMLKSNNELVSFYQEEKSIACGVFYMKENSMYSSLLLYEINKLYQNNIGLVAKWGTFGPEFFTNFIFNYNLENGVFSKELCYSIHWEEFNLFIDESKKQDVLHRIKDSYLTHIWNTFFNKHAIDKNNPPKDSFLFDIYKQCKLID